MKIGCSACSIDLPGLSDVANVRLRQLGVCEGRSLLADTHPIRLNSYFFVFNHKLPAILRDFQASIITLKGTVLGFPYQRLL